MDSSEKIINKLTKKATTKQEVYRICKSFFDMLKEVISELSKELSKEILKLDKHVEIKYIDKGEFEIQLKFSGDTLIFHMHSNTFSFDKSHQIWKSSYVKEDEYRAYCGVINIYKPIRFGAFSSLGGYKHKDSGKIHDLMGGGGSKQS